MKIEYLTSPFEHIIIKDVFDENTQKQIINEVEFIKTLGVEEVTQSSFDYSYDGEKYDRLIAGIDGSAIDNTGKKLSSKKSIFLNEYFVNLYALTSTKNLFTVLKSNIESKNFFTDTLVRTSLFNITTSFWLDGDYYENHSDKALITSIYYIIPNEQDFEGGTLCFGNKAGYKIQPTNNSLIFFPGSITHSVSKLSVFDRNKKNHIMRTGITFWLTIPKDNL